VAPATLLEFARMGDALAYPFEHDDEGNLGLPALSVAQAASEHEVDRGREVRPRASRIAGTASTKEVMPKIYRSRRNGGALLRDRVERTREALRPVFREEELGALVGGGLGRGTVAHGRTIVHGPGLASRRAGR